MRAAAAVLLVFGVLLVLGGIGAIGYAATPTSDSATITIPSGSGWYYAYDFALLAGGHIGGTYQERTGGTVDVFVFTDAQYQVYDSGGSAQWLFSTSGSSGQLDVALPGSDTFHLIFDHGPGYDSTEQDVDVAITVSGIGPPSYVYGGIAGLVVGIGLLAIGGWKARQEKRAPQAWMPPSWAPGPPPGALPAPWTQSGPPPTMPPPAMLPAAPSAMGRACPSCGASLPPDVIFCMNCGSRVA